MEDRLQVGVVRMGLGCAAVLAGAGWAGAQPVALPPAPAGVEVTREQGFEFVTVRGGGEQWTAPQYDPFFGTAPKFGAVVSDYRISRTEVRVADFVDFFNVLSTHPSQLPAVTAVRVDVRSGPTMGLVEDRSYSGPGVRWQVAPGQGNLPIDGVSWYTAAMFCNYLHNDRLPTMDAVLSGAYDLRLFSDGQAEPRSHSPNARFWIPSADQWFRAAYYDFNNSMWRETPTPTGDPVIYGLPGIGEAGAGIYSYLPVGQYPLQSPSGMLDAAGSVTEWTEFAWPLQDPSWPVSGRMAVGSGYYDAPELAGYLDRLGNYQFFGPNSLAGIRLAAAIPTPSSFVVFLLLSFCSFNRRRSA